MLQKADVRGHAPLALPVHLAPVLDVGEVGGSDGSRAGGKGDADDCGHHAACRVRPEAYIEALSAHVDAMRSLAEGLPRIDSSVLGATATPESRRGTLGGGVALSQACEVTWRAVEGSLREAAAMVHETLTLLNDVPVIRELSRPRPVSLEAASSSAMLTLICEQVEEERREVLETNGLIDDEIVVGAFCLDCRPLKAEILALREGQVQKLLGELRRQVHSRCEVMSGRYDKLMRSLKAMPATADDLCTLWPLNAPLSHWTSVISALTSSLSPRRACAQTPPSCHNHPLIIPLPTLPPSPLPPPSSTPLHPLPLPDPLAARSSQAKDPRRLHRQS